MNLEDVARKAGVSTATVSRVLNNIGVVRESTRQRVLAAAEELKYYPNVHARALAGGNSRTVGIIVSNLENPFFIDVYRSFQELALEQGYEVLIANTDYDPMRLKTNVRLMIGRRLAGLALVVSEMDESLLEELNERGVPTAVLDVGSPREHVSCIRTNYRHGMQKIAKALHDLGHRKVAFVGHHTGLGPLSDRRQTFVEVMEQFSPKVEYQLLADSDSLEGAQRAVAEMLRSGFRPTAVVCVNDFMAIGVLHALRRAGLRVPEDVSVTGFDNIDLAAVVSPTLTTAQVPLGEIGRKLFESLMAEGSKETIIEPELVLRESTGKARG